jgi:hypothetical protein
MKGKVDVDLLDPAVALSLQALPVVKVELDTPSERGWRQSSTWKPACGSTTTAGTSSMIVVSINDISVSFTLAYETISL